MEAALEAVEDQVVALEDQVVASEAEVLSQALAAWAVEAVPQTWSLVAMEVVLEAVEVELSLAWVQIG